MNADERAPHKRSKHSSSMNGMKLKGMKGFGSSAMGRLHGGGLDDMGSRMAYLERDNEGNPLGDTEEKQVDADFFNGAQPCSLRLDAWGTDVSCIAEGTALTQRFHRAWAEISSPLWLREATPAAWVQSALLLVRQGRGVHPYRGRGRRLRALQLSGPTPTAAPRGRTGRRTVG
jgi:hypothetical protein